MWRVSTNCYTNPRLVGTQPCRRHEAATHSCTLLGFAQTCRVQGRAQNGVFTFFGPTQKRRRMSSCRSSRSRFSNFLAIETGALTYVNQPGNSGCAPTVRQTKKNHRIPKNQPRTGAKASKPLRWRTAPCMTTPLTSQKRHYRRAKRHLEGST